MVHITAWRRPGAKPLFEPIMAGLRMHMCVSRLQWVNIHVLINMGNFIGVKMVKNMTMTKTVLRYTGTGVKAFANQACHWVGTFYLTWFPSFTNVSIPEYNKIALSNPYWKANIHIARFHKARSIGICDRAEIWQASLQLCCVEKLSSQ